MVQLTDITNLTNATLTASQLNANSAAIEVEFTKVLYANGRKALTDDLDINGQRLLNVAAPQSSTDAVRLVDVQSGFSGGSLLIPALVGNENRYLKTDGLTVFWDRDEIEKLLNSRVLHLTDFGVIPDGITDCTQFVNDAIDAIEAIGGGYLIAPYGVILVDGITRNVSTAAEWAILGQGKRSSVFRKRGSSFTPIFTINASASIEWFGGFADVGFDGMNVAGVSGLVLKKVARARTDRLMFRNCPAVGCDIDGALILSFNDCSSNGNGTGYRTRKFSSGGTPFANLISWNQGEARGNTTAGFDIGESDALTFRDLDISGNGTAGNTLTGGMIIRSTVDDETGYSGIKLENCFFEINNGWAFRVEAPGGLRLELDSCKFYGNESGRDTSIGEIALAMLTNCTSSGITNIAASRSIVMGGLHTTFNDTSVKRDHLFVSSSGPDIPVSFMNGALRVDLGSIGFYGTSPVGKPTVTGSRAGNAALASLLTGLAAQGLITDSTTA